MQQQLSESGINLDCIARSDICAVTHWLLRSAAVSNCLHQLGSKSEIAPDLFRSKLNEMLAVFDCCERIYNDASKDGPAEVAAAVSSLGTELKRLPSDASIFSGEAGAILLGLDMAQ
jgi:hypothetical protein